MKKQVVTASTKFGLLLLVTLVLACASANAQSLEYPLKANTPFDFTVGHKKLPAGEYSFSRAQASAGDLIVKIASANGHARSFPITNSVVRLNATGKGSVVFHRYGDEYFLSQVWPAGATTGRALTRSREERELERKLRDPMVAAMKADTVGTVTIAADLP